MPQSSCLESTFASPAATRVALRAGGSRIWKLVRSAPACFRAPAWLLAASTCLVSCYSQLCVPPPEENTQALVDALSRDDERGACALLAHPDNCAGLLEWFRKSVPYLRGAHVTRVAAYFGFHGGMFYERAIAEGGGGRGNLYLWWMCCRDDECRDYPGSASCPHGGAWKLYRYSGAAKEALTVSPDAAPTAADSG